MSPNPRRAILLMLPLASALHGCNCGHRQMVRVDTGREVRVRAPFVDVRVPTGEPGLDRDHDRDRFDEDDD